MNPGVTEEAGKTAQTVVEALKTTPALLALVIFNLIFLFMMGYLSVKSGDRLEREIARWQEMATSAVKVCGEPK
jgi:hypothetical protein